ncbi:MAG: sugar ABC transporter ATP-binding protein [Bacteroidales bacterium]|nr:sugar ABC transporter ATP-binding protein [Bacteroidales bacterium]
MALLKATGIRKAFGGVVALNNANLTCEAGKITGLLGSNGSGKSTIAKIITGLLKKDSGIIEFDSKEVEFKNPSEAKANGISMVFQNLSLIPDLTVWQNINLGMEKKRKIFLDDTYAIKFAQELVTNLMPDINVNKKVNVLNPGEKQVTEIAKAISVKPKLLILDEPTAALEQLEVRYLFQFMRKLTSEGTAIVFTSHRIWEVMEICDNITVFRNGENAGNIDFSLEKKNADAVIDLIIGETGSLKVVKEYHEIEDEYILEVNNLNYGKYLKSVGFKLKKGEILGIGGLAGQGQDELMLALAGNFQAAKGDVHINGKKILVSKSSHAVRAGMMLVPGDRQKEGVFFDKSIYFNMIFPKLGLPHQPLFTPKKKYRREAEEICKALSIKTSSIDTLLNTLSGGNQQKVVVGKWLPFAIKVLLLADPAKGVDIKARKDLYDFIIKLVKEKNMSVIIYASDNDELVSYCDRVLIMYEGRITAELTGNEISEDNIVAKSIKVN